VDISLFGDVRYAAEALRHADTPSLESGVLIAW
jgi:hypothetical protein